MQTSPKPDNISGLMALLGLIALVAGLVIRLLLPEIRISAWGILAVGIALLAAAFIINFRWVSRAVTGRSARGSASLMDIGNLVAVLAPLPLGILWLLVQMLKGITARWTQF